MRHLVIFLNELSCITDREAPRQEILTAVLSTLSALRAVRRLRPDVLVAGVTQISGAVFCDGTCALAAVLAGDAYKEEWRFLRMLDQRNPWETHPHAVRPGDLEEVAFQGRPAVGMTWARRNGTAVFSFGLPPHWNQDPLRATYIQLDGNGEPSVVAVDIANLSRREDVERNANTLRNYGGDVSPSTLVHVGNGFVVRMFFDDHYPPHFHVLLRRDTSDTQAKCTVETLDIMAGSLAPALWRRVREWAVRRRGELMRNWDRCRNGQHPLMIDDEL